MVSVVTDLGPVRYEPPLTRSTPQRRDLAVTVLWTGPRFIRGASRWHRVRSSVQYPHHPGPVWAMWCGQTRFDRDRPGRSDELPTDGLPLCGTCEGRAAGAGHASPLSGHVELLFRPNRLTPPRWCPGGKHRSIHEVVGRRALRCGACAEVVPERNAHPWYDTAGMPRQHEPGPGLVPGCPQHAWRHLIRTPEGVACQCSGLPES